MRLYFYAPAPNYSYQKNFTEDSLVAMPPSAPLTRVITLTECSTWYPKGGIIEPSSRSLPEPVKKYTLLVPGSYRKRSWARASSSK